MDKDTVKEKLNVIFRDIFDNPSLHIREDMTAADVKGWDSLSHIDLIFAVEKEFKIKLTTKEVRGLNSVGDLIAIVSQKAA